VRPKLRRITAAAVLCAMMSGSAVLATAPAPASAGQVPCPSFTAPNVEYGSVGGIGVLKVLRLVSATPTFDRVDSRSVDNPLDMPVSATFTSQNSSTISIAAGAQVKIVPTLLRFFEVTVSTTITVTKTTQIGVSTTATVPPHTRLVGEYGVSSFDITYDVDVLFVDDGPTCFFGGTARESRHAPTDNEGWRLSLTNI
jgi:hypothetical protein